MTTVSQEERKRGGGGGTRGRMDEKKLVREKKRQEGMTDRQIDRSETEQLAQTIICHGNENMTKKKKGNDTERGS